MKDKENETLYFGSIFFSTQINTRGVRGADRDRRFETITRLIIQLLMVAERVKTERERKTLFSRHSIVQRILLVVISIPIIDYVSVVKAYL